MPVFLKEHRYFLAGIFGSTLLMLGVFLMASYGKDFLASVLNVAQPAPFDGTALPLQQVPNWTKLTGAESQLTADVLSPGKLMPLPTYDGSVFGTKIADVNWKTQPALINELLTYSTPYMGTYQAGSKEYDGSHLGIDIRTPIGTPVHAIANGKVVKVAQSDSGFGMHIVVEHPSVPLADQNKTETLYSGYAHLSQTKVVVGDIVKRGDLIALSGNSGTSSGAHLHFQIDRSTAPWHPWWPYSSTDTRAAGVDFSDGVDLGLGKQAAITNTLNPLVWVQKYLTNAPVAPTTDSPVLAAADTPVTFVLSGDSFAVVGGSASLLLTAKNAQGQQVSSFTLPDRVNLTVSGGDAAVSPQSLTASDFAGGVAKVQVRSEQPAPIQVAVAGSDAPAAKITFVSDSGATSTPSGTTPSSPTTPTTPVVTPVDDTPALPATGDSFSDVAGNYAYVKAISYLKAQSILGGYPDGTFQPDKTVSRVEALKILTKALQINVPGQAKLTFKDTDDTAWYAPFIQGALDEKMASGYADGTFKPAATVNRAEYLKLLTLASREQVPGVPYKPYPDVSQDDWFASYAMFAAQKNLMPDRTALKASTGMTRGEVAETIYRLLAVKKNRGLMYDGKITP